MKEACVVRIDPAIGWPSVQANSLTPIFTEYALPAREEPAQDIIIPGIRT